MKSRLSTVKTSDLHPGDAVINEGEIQFIIEIILLDDGYVNITYIWRGRIARETHVGTFVVERIIVQ